jgi:hypothetical protein
LGNVEIELCVGLSNMENIKCHHELQGTFTIMPLADQHDLRCIRPGWGTAITRAAKNVTFSRYLKNCSSSPSGAQHHDQKDLQCGPIFALHWSLSTLPLYVTSFADLQYIGQKHCDTILNSGNLCAWRSSSSRCNTDLYYYDSQPSIVVGRSTH